MLKSSARVFGAFAVGGLVMVCIAATMAASSEASHALQTQSTDAVNTIDGTPGSYPQIDYVMSPHPVVSHKSWEALMFSWKR